MKTLNKIISAIYNERFNTSLKTDVEEYAKVRFNKRKSQKYLTRFVKTGIMTYTKPKNQKEGYYWNSKSLLGKVCINYFVGIVSGLSKDYLKGKYDWNTLVKE